MLVGSRPQSQRLQLPQALIATTYPILHCLHTTCANCKLVQSKTRVTSVRFSFRHNVGDICLHDLEDGHWTSEDAPLENENKQHGAWFRLATAGWCVLLMIHVHLLCPLTL